MTKQDILNLIDQPEGLTIEYKSAKGGIPQSLWESYSSFANANGGVIVLGMKEKNGQVVPDELSHEQILTYKKRLWDCLHNRDVVSLCLLSDKDVEEADVDGSWLLIIRVPRARYDQRPIYLTRNPFGNTFLRNHEGDYHCTDEEVRLMFTDAESDKHSYDSKILVGFTLDHMDMPTIKAYRNRFNVFNPDHPWSGLGDIEFLTKIGAYSVDAIKGEEGFTRAGTLMFGKTESITNPACAPYFFPDLQEWHIIDRGERWSDRICPDGYWEANLYQFFMRAFAKLVQQLPVPFKMEGIQRIDETPAHKSVREALVNALVHTNYRVMGSTLIKIEPSRIIMRNPGRMLVSVQEYYAGSHSVCRNPILQNMFRFIGYGEKAGSGADIIAKGWEENKWERPVIKENLAQPEYTELVLDLVKMAQNEGQSVPQNVADGVADELTERQKVILETLRNVALNVALNTKYLAEQLNVNRKTIQRDLASLQEKHLIRWIGSKKSGHWGIIEKDEK